MDKIAAFLRDIESLSELIRPILRNMLNRHIDKLNMLASHVGVGNFTLAVCGEFYIGTDTNPSTSTLRGIRSRCFVGHPCRWRGDVAVPPAAFVEEASF